MSNEIQPMQRLNELLATKGVRERFEDMLKDRAGSFLSSIISTVRNNKSLESCDPMSIIAAGAVAASLDLSITLGHAYIVPYKGIATFQIGWSGYIQLFLRTGQAASINALVIREGDIKAKNRLTGEIELNEDEHPQNKIVGYLSYFSLKNGYHHGWFMTPEEIEYHAKHYSQSYQYDLREGKKASKWSTDREAMALKTVTKMNLKKYAPLSIEMQKAMEVDDAIDVEGKTVYPDAPALPESTQTLPEAPKTTSTKLQQAVGVKPPSAPPIPAPTVPTPTPDNSSDFDHEQEALPI